jgi:hypothetical protein
MKRSLEWIAIGLVAAGGLGNNCIRVDEQQLGDEWDKAQAKKDKEARKKEAATTQPPVQPKPQPNP